MIVLVYGTKVLPYKLFLNKGEQFAKWADFPWIRASSFQLKFARIWEKSVIFCQKYSASFAPYS